MTKIEQLLRKAYPDRSSFSEGEKAFASDIVTALSTSKPRCSTLPHIFVPIGGTYVVSGRTYRCVKRKRVISPCEACSGCDFFRKKRSCLFAGLQCSKFDRSDNTFVWFEEVK